MHPSVLIERTAQALLNNPQDSNALLVACKQKLWQYYGRLHDRLPHKATFLVVRSLRGAVFAALSHIMYTDLVKTVWPYLETNTSLVAAAPSSHRTALAAYGSRHIQPYQGSCDLFMRTLTAWLQEASIHTLDRLRHDSGDPNTPLWAALASLHQELEEALLAYQGPHAHGPTPDAYKDWIEVTMPENAEGIMGVLVASAAAYTHGRGPLNATFLAENASSQLDALSWMAHVSSRLTAPCFHGEASLSRQLFPYENQILPSVEGFFPEFALIWNERERALPRYWERSGLSDGPWERPGFCPATSPLQSPRAEDQVLVEGLYQWFGERYPETQIIWSGLDGMTDRVTLGLLLGIVIAEETIYAAWPTVQSPVWYQHTSSGGVFALRRR